MTNRIGAYLRQKREEQHLTLQQVAEHTGIRENYLTALEEGHFSTIPGDVFIRGFLRNYGNYLGLDGNLVVEVYRMDLNPEKILGKLSKPLEALPKETEKQEETTAPQKPAESGASSDTIIITPGMFSVSHKDVTEAAVPEEAPATAEPKQEEAAQAAAATVAAEQASEQAPAVEETPEEPVAQKAEAEDTESAASADAEAAVAMAAGAAVAAAQLHKAQETATAEETEKRNKEEAAVMAAAASGSSKGKFHSVIDTIRDFIDENLYETVLDEEDEGEEEKEAEPAAEPAKPAFSFKVFTAVFLVCLAIFTVVMAYFIFGGKTQEELKPTTKITDGVKSDHSSEKSEEAKKAEAEKAAKEAEAKKKAEEEEKKKKQATNKTLGLGSKVTVQIKYKKAVWTQTHVDGKVVEAVVVPAGSTRTYKGDREVRLNLGSIRDVEIHVNGKLVPYGEKEWGVANKVFTPRS